MAINLNDCVKFKLTDYGKDIYYHRFDNFIEKHPEFGLERRMPVVDEEGYSKMQLWCFMELYGPYMGMARPNVIEPLVIVVEED